MSNISFRISQAYGRTTSHLNTVLLQHWQSLNFMWITLAVGYAWVFMLVILGKPTGHTSAPTEGSLREEHLQLDEYPRRAIATVACTASTISAYYTLGVASYAKGPKRFPVLSAFLVYLLITLLFASDAGDIMFRPFNVELQNYAIHVISAFMMHSAFGTLIAMRHGADQARVELAKPCMYGVLLWGLTLPAPLGVISLGSRGSWSGPFALVVACTAVIGYTVTYRAAATRMQQMLHLHRTIRVNGMMTVVSWVFTYLIYFGVASRQGLTMVNARAMFIFTLVYQSTQIGLIVFQAIDSFEESARFKSERDAAQAELLVRSEQQRQAKAAEDARQKFLRYIFHEIRVPFNSVDMGLGLLREDIKASRRRQALSPSALSSISDGPGAHLLTNRPGSGRAHGQTPLPDRLDNMDEASVHSAEAAGELRLPADAADIVETITKACTSMMVIINDTLDWTKLQSGSFKIRPMPTDVRTELRHTLDGLRSFAQHNRVEIVNEIDESLPKCLLVDSVRLQQVVANYVSNACKFARTDGTGTVVVRFLCLRDGATKHRSNPHAASVITLLRDGRRHSTPMCQAVTPFNFQHVCWKEPSSASSAEAQREARLANGHGQGTLSNGQGSMRPNHMEQSAAPPSNAVALLLSGQPGVSAGSTLFDPEKDLQAAQLDKDTLHRLAEQGYCLAGQSPASAAPSVSRSNEDEPSSVCLAISVQDNGQGIAAAEVSLLFDAFRQLDAGMQYKGKGTGLGLAICHEIVSMHGGRVGVRSSGQPGDGAEFIAVLRLPVLTKVSPDETSLSTNAPSLHEQVAVSMRAEPLAMEGRRPVGQHKSSRDPGPAHSSSATEDGPTLFAGDVSVGPQAVAVCTTTGPSRERQHSLAEDGRGPSDGREEATSLTQDCSGFDGGDPVLSPPSCMPGQVDTAHDGWTSTYGADQPAVASPRALTHGSASSAAGATQAPALRLLRLLLVDDVKDNRKLLKKALQRRLETLLVRHRLPASGTMAGGRQWLGVHCDEAEDGHVAVEMVAKNGVGYYNVITMDAEMPTMSGFVATERIRAAGYTGLLFGCTGNALESDQALFVTNGADAVYIKPLDITELSDDIYRRLQM